MNRDRYLVVLSGPSGTGKDTVAKRLRELHPELETSVSATTRPIRQNEKEGVDYFYLTRQEFEEWIRADKIVEYTQYADNYYGTPRSEVERSIEKQATMLLVIEVEGAQNIKRLYPGATTIFLCPPSMEELERRLRARGTESEEQIQKRLARAKEELLLADQYDERVVNDTVEQCAQQIYALIQKHQQD